MHIVITGANGFVGKALARKLQDEAEFGAVAIDCLSLLDIEFDDQPTVPFTQQYSGDISDNAWLRHALSNQTIDVIFHLASVPGGLAEQHYELSRDVNIGATTALLECGKTQVEAGGKPPVFIFASSIAVFGSFPDVVTDTTLLKPKMTYGAQKVIGEVLVEDFSRRGWVDGRSLRLSGVLARPKAPTGQMSAFMSDIIHELAHGRPFECPTTPNATIWASSLACMIENLCHGAIVSAHDLGQTRTFTLPALHFSMAELVEAIGQVYLTQASSLVSYRPNVLIEELFGRFPPLITTSADSIGFQHDGTLVALVRKALIQ